MVSQWTFLPQTTFSMLPLRDTLPVFKKPLAFSQRAKIESG
jgi:hypothetical protein